jgi:S1-C subfamily serine protease
MEFGRQRVSTTQGNGFFVSRKGCLVTAYHWFRRKKENLLLDPSYGASRARMVGAAPEDDIAVMRAEGARDVPVFRLTETVYPPEPGEEYLMLSRPGSVTLINAVSRWQAQVPVKGKTQGGPNGLAADVPEGTFKAYLFRGKGEPGQSGSPVVNRNGEVFGMFIASDTDRDLLVVIPLSLAILKDVWGDC